MRTIAIVLLQLFFYSFFILRSFGQDWIINNNTTLRVPVSNLVTELQATGKIQVSIPKDALLAAVAETLNSTRKTVYNECGSRASGTWTTGKTDKPIMTFAATVEMWSCVTISIPKLNGFSVHTEQNKIKTKLIETTVLVNFQSTIIANDANINVHLDSPQVIGVDFPRDDFTRQLLNMSSTTISFKQVQFVSRSDDDSDIYKLGSRILQVSALKDISVSDDGRVQFVLPPP